MSGPASCNKDAIAARSKGISGEELVPQLRLIGIALPLFVQYESEIIKAKLIDQFIAHSPSIPTNLK